MGKKLLIIAIILIVTGSVLLLIKNNQNDESNKSKEDNSIKICNLVTEDINNKKDTILYFKTEEAKIETSQITNYLKSTYPNLNIHTFKFEDKEVKCMKEMLEEKDLYREIIEPSTMIIYKQGEYKGFMVNANKKEKVENYLDELNVIEKPEIKENVTLNEVKNKIKEDKYILLIVGEENARKIFGQEFKEKMSEYNYDIVNLESKTGKQIKNYIYENYSKVNEFSQAYYFSNGKLQLNETIYGKESIDEFKQSIKSYIKVE